MFLVALFPNEKFTVREWSKAQCARKISLLYEFLAIFEKYTTKRGTTIHWSEIFHSHWQKSRRGTFKGLKNVFEKQLA